MGHTNQGDLLPPQPGDLARLRFRGQDPDRGHTPSRKDHHQPTKASPTETPAKGEVKPKAPKRRTPAPASGRKRVPMSPAPEQGTVGQLCVRELTADDTVVVAQGDLYL